MEKSTCNEKKHMVILIGTCSRSNEGWSHQLFGRTHQKLMFMIVNKMKNASVLSKCWRHRNKNVHYNVNEKNAAVLCTCCRRWHRTSSPPIARDLLAARRTQRARRRCSSPVARRTRSVRPCCSSPVISLAAPRTRRVPFCCHCRCRTLPNAAPKLSG